MGLPSVVRVVLFSEHPLRKSDTGRLTVATDLPSTPVAVSVDGFVASQGETDEEALSEMASMLIWYADRDDFATTPTPAHYTEKWDHADEHSRVRVSDGCEMHVRKLLAETGAVKP